MTRWILVSLLLAGVAVAQEGPDPAVLAAIDDDVWRRFEASFAANDADTYLSLHTDDVVRVGIERGSVRAGTTFHDRTRARMSRAREEGRRFTITFRFTRRMHDADATAAYEEGLYRVAAADASHVSYGRFTVLLRKVDGHWRIAMDADRPATEADFEAASEGSNR